jgi:hypothetical protein
VRMSEEREKSDKREAYVRVRGRLWVARGRWPVAGVKVGHSGGGKELDWKPFHLWPPLYNMVWSYRKAGNRACK